MEVIGYTYDADHWCPDCLQKEGVDLSDDEVGVIFTYADCDYPMHCGVCGEFLGGSITADGIEELKKAYREGYYRAPNGGPSTQFQEYMAHYHGVDWRCLWTFVGLMDPCNYIKY